MDETEIRARVSGVSPSHGVCISVVRNERKRLPAWLAHYRRLGAPQFIIFDNDSTDGTGDYLAAQPDVCVIPTTASYREANFGMAWVNAARAALPQGCWTLVVDADEYLVYRGAPERSLRQFLGSLEGGANSVFAFMVDMYPEGSVFDVEADEDLVAKCCFFDHRYYFRPRPEKPWKIASGSIEVLGGPRLRMFSDVQRELRTNWIDYMIRGQLGRILQATPRRWHRRIVEHFPAQPPGLDKTPFARIAQGGPRYTNGHSVTSPVYAGENAIILHYKFTADFRDKIAAELHRREHFRFGSEYMLYDSIIRRAATWCCIRAN